MKKPRENRNHTFLNKYTLWQEVPVSNISIKTHLCVKFYIHTFPMSDCLESSIVPTDVIVNKMWLFCYHTLVQPFFHPKCVFLTKKSQTELMEWKVHNEHISIKITHEKHNCASSS